MVPANWRRNKERKRGNEVGRKGKRKEERAVGSRACKFLFWTLVYSRCWHTFL